MQTDNQLAVYLEIGKKRAFACAIKWPGWCRSGRDEEAAIQALVSYASRYSRIIKATSLALPIPKISDINIVDRIKGSFATDFGVPEKPIAADEAPLSTEEIQRYNKILKASWLYFDQTVQSAQGKQLRKGPRGGGRELSEIVSHVALAEKGYLRHLGWSGVIPDETDINLWMGHVRQEILSGIQAAAGQYPKEGPHGGKRWPLHYFVRRVAWHVIDHTWEIEDRII